MKHWANTNVDMHFVIYPEQRVCEVDSAPGCHHAHQQRDADHRRLGVCVCLLLAAANKRPTSSVRHGRHGFSTAQTAAGLQTAQQTPYERRPRRGHGSSLDLRCYFRDEWDAGLFFVDTFISSGRSLSDVTATWWSCSAWHNRSLVVQMWSLYFPSHAN